MVGNEGNVKDKSNRESTIIDKIDANEVIEASTIESEVERNSTSEILLK